ncbi:Hypothetical_protein [Hexamita inflata]|uniref:Hypothetical_protein n=1 Tax=Hexamita inflata TaxID=28002 RepID=A0AA86PHF1_9EUKA|nr:Hypothetical protein HINF_LOCUS27109 [Hexamita inflata]
MSPHAASQIQISCIQLIKYYYLLSYPSWQRDIFQVRKYVNSCWYFFVASVQRRLLPAMLVCINAYREQNCTKLSRSCLYENTQGCGQTCVPAMKFLTIFTHLMCCSRQYRMHACLLVQAILQYILVTTIYKVEDKQLQVSQHSMQCRYYFA